jgi:hypothetical protein
MGQERSMNVEPVGVRVAVLVVVGRPDEDAQVPPGRDVHTSQARIAGRSANHPQERCLPSQPFLDRGATEVGLMGDILELVGARQEREQQVAERPVRGFDPGGEYACTTEANTIPETDARRVAVALFGRTAPNCRSVLRTAAQNDAPE